MDMADEIILHALLWVPKQRLPYALKNDIRKQHVVRQRMGASASYGPPKVVEAFRETRTHIGIPRRSPIAETIMRSYAYQDMRSQGESIQLPWQGEYRTGQRLFVEDLEDVSLENGIGALGKAGCGFGKTVSATALISKLDRTTLICVHKGFLMKQWAAACQKFLGYKPGIVQRNKCDFKGKKIVIGMLQSLHQKEYPEEFYKHFGLVVVDECHRISAPTFSNAVIKFPAQYRIGLTATPRRGDKMENVFFWHLGDIEAVGIGAFLDCGVYGIRTGIQVYEDEYSGRGGQPNLSKLLTILTEIPSRNELCLRLLTKAALEGRRVLALSHRVAHIEYLVDHLNATFRAMGVNKTAGNYVAGTTKKAQRLQEEAAACDVTIGTWNMAAEGLDVPDKDCLAALTPVKDIEQAAGRVRRIFKDKRDPMILHLCDDIGICWGLWKHCARYYRTPDDDKDRWPVRMVGAST